MNELRVVWRHTENKLFVTLRRIVLNKPEETEDKNFAIGNKWIAISDLRLIYLSPG